MSEPTHGEDQDTPSGPIAEGEEELERLTEPPVNTSKKGPLAWMAQNNVAANLIMFFLLIGGALMLPSIKQEVFPEFELDLVVVNVPYPGASPTEVEQGVLLAIEEAIQGLDGVKELRGTASEGVGVVVVELIEGTDSDRALSDVKAAVDRISSFPEDIERPVVSLALMRRQVASLVIYGDRSEAELRNLAENARDALLADDEISYVELGGVRPYEISVEVPQQNSRRYGLDLGQIAQRIRAASVDLPAGGVRTDAGEVLLRTTERRRTGEEFGDIVLLSQPDGTEVRVRDVGTVTDGFAETDLETYYNGHRAAVVDVFRVGDETPIDVSDAIKRFVAENEANLPEGVHYDIWSDMSEIYKDRIDLLLRNAYIGLLLVLLTLGLFLEIRLAFWVTMGIPISFIGSLFFMPTMDVSVNMISLFAFIVTLGMVVDDAIVVGEAVYKHRQEGMGRLDAAIAGVREVAGPVVFAIATTCMAFAPLLFVPGVMGKFFKVIPMIVITVLLISLVESLVVLPAHLAHSSNSERGLFGFIHKQQQRISRMIEWLIDRTYVPTVRWAVNNRYLTAAICMSMLIATMGLVAGGRIGFTFMPKIERDEIKAQLEMPFGTSIEQTRIARQKLEDALGEALATFGDPDEPVRGVFAYAGAHSGNRGPGGNRGGSASHMAEVSVYLVPMSDRDFTAADLTRVWRERVGDIAGAETLTFNFSSGPADGSPVDIELSHPDMETLETAAERLAEIVGTYGGAKDIDDGFALGKEQLDFTLTPEARAMGLTETDVARQVRNAFFGAEAVRQQRGRDEVRTYVRRPLEERQSMYDIERLILSTPRGGEIPLGQAAIIERGRAYTQNLPRRPTPHRPRHRRRRGRHERLRGGGRHRARQHARAPRRLPRAPLPAHRRREEPRRGPRRARARHDPRPPRDVRPPRHRLQELRPADHRHERHPLRDDRRRPRAHPDGLRSVADVDDGHRRSIRCRGERLADPGRRRQPLSRRGPGLLRGHHQRRPASLPADHPDLAHDLLRPGTDDHGDLDAGALPDPDGPQPRLRRALRDLHHPAAGPVPLHDRRRPRHARPRSVALRLRTHRRACRRRVAAHLLVITWVPSQSSGGGASAYVRARSAMVRLGPSSPPNASAAASKASAASANFRAR